MYTVEPFNAKLRAAQVTEGGEHSITKVLAATLAHGQWYRNNGARLGPLYPPNRGAELIFQENPGLHRLAIYVVRRRISWNGIVRHSNVRYEYVRPGTLVQRSSAIQ